MTEELKRSAATALVAMVQRISLREAVDEAAFTRLLAEITTNPTERDALIDAMRRANDPDLRSILIDRLRVHAVKRSAAAERIAGKDAALGPVALGVGGSLIAAGVGATITGTIGGLAAATAIAGPVALVLAACLARVWLSGRRVDARQEADLAAELVKSLQDISTKPADPPKSPRK